MYRFALLLLFVVLLVGCTYGPAEIYVGMPMEEAEKLVARHCPRKFEVAVADLEGNPGVGYIPLLDSNTGIRMFASEADPTVLGAIYLDHGLGGPKGLIKTKKVEIVVLPGT